MFNDNFSRKRINIIITYEVMKKRKQGEIKVTFFVPTFNTLNTHVDLLNP